MTSIANLRPLSIQAPINSITERRSCCKCDITERCARIAAAVFGSALLGTAAWVFIAKKDPTGGIPALFGILLLIGAFIGVPPPGSGGGRGLSPTEIDID